MDDKRLNKLAHLLPWAIGAALFAAPVHAETHAATFELRALDTALQLRGDFAKGRTQEATALVNKLKACGVQAYQIGDTLVRLDDLDTLRQHLLGASGGVAFHLGRRIAPVTSCEAGDDTFPVSSSGA